jgi:cyanophycinase
MTLLYYCSKASVSALFCLAMTLTACAQQPATTPSPSNNTANTITLPAWMLGITGDTADVQGANMQMQAGTVLMGGSTDVDAAMRWMLTRAGGGDVVILRASGGTGYNDYLFHELGVKVNSVETLLINSVERANDPAVDRRVRNAEMVFIAGGDQANYVNFWRGTKLHDALKYLAATKKIPIGGTSAGCAILGKMYFGAMNGTVRSEEALANPYNPLVTIGRNDFLATPFLDNTITDTHYDNPERLGRHITFIARAVKDWAVAARGIGVEERTAVAIDAKGVATVFGSGSAYFLEQAAVGSSPEVCEAGKPLTWDRNKSAVRAYIIKGLDVGSGSFDVATWAVLARQGGREVRYVVQNGIVKQE